MDPNSCGELYPSGYLNMIAAITNHIFNSEGDNPTDEQIEQQMLAIEMSVRSQLAAQQRTNELESYKCGMSMEELENK